MKKSFLIAALCAVTVAAGVACFASCGNKEIDSRDDKLMYSHNCTYTAAVEATCQSEGSVAYYYCERCDAYFYGDYGFFTSDPNWKDTGDFTASEIVTSKTPHDYDENGVCRMCGEKGSYTPSEGLKYNLNEDENGKYYSVSSMGTCTDEVVVIPSTYNSLPVLRIDNCAFTEQNMRAVIISEGITEIEESAFNYCDKLESVFIPDSVTKIGSSAFADDDRLGLTENDITYVDNWAVYTNSNECGSALREGTVGVASYAGSGITGSVILPESLKYIGDYAFHGSNIKVLIIGDNVEQIGAYAFYSSWRLESVTFGKGLKSIGEEAFADCSALPEIAIPEGVTELGDGAFEGCSNLLLITLPESLEKIGANAFKDCQSLVIAEFGSAEGWTSDGAAIDSSALSDLGKSAGLLTETQTEWRKLIDN